MNYISIIINYLIIVNIIGYLAMASDKSRAQKSQWRIPEKDLFLIAILGGSLGCILGMYGFRHKTKKDTFVIGMPLIGVIQLAVINILIRVF